MVQAGYSTPSSKPLLHERDLPLHLIMIFESLIHWYSSVIVIMVLENLWPRYRTLCCRSTTASSPPTAILTQNKLIWFSRVSLSFIALYCYPNENGSVRNLSLNTSTVPIFSLFNYFRENIWATIEAQFRFLYIFFRTSWQGTQNFTSNHVYFTFCLQTSKVLGTSLTDLLK